MNVQHEGNQKAVQDTLTQLPEPDLKSEGAQEALTEPVERSFGGSS